MNTLSRRYNIGLVVDVVVWLAAFTVAIYYAVIGEFERSLLVFLLLANLSTMEFVRRLANELKATNALVADLADFILDTYRRPKP